MFLHICHRKSAILDFYFLSAMFVYKLHFLLAILVLQFHPTLTINCEMKLKVDLWLDYGYFVFGMGQYTLFPRDFNGKPEIFLKHFKKKFLCVCACVCDWTLIIFQDNFALHYLMSTLFFLKKKNFFWVYFNTNNFEIFSCQPCGTCVSHVGFLKIFFVKPCVDIQL